MILWRGCCVRDWGRGSEVGRAKKGGVRTALLEIIFYSVDSIVDLKKSENRIFQGVWLKKVGKP